MNYHLYSQHNYINIKPNYTKLISKYTESSHEVQSQLGSWVAHPFSSLFRKRLQIILFASDRTNLGRERL